MPLKRSRTGPSAIQLVTNEFRKVDHSMSKPSHRIHSRLFTGFIGIASVLVCGAMPLTVAKSASAATVEVPAVRKVALVDLQRVLSETKQGKNARKELETSSAAKQKQLDEKRTKLEADQAKIKNMTGEAQAAAMQKLERDAQELQGVYMALQQELAQQEGKLLNQIYSNCQKIVGTLAAQLGVDLVLVRDQNTVIHAVAGLDITSQLIAKYDTEFAK
jgi:outer membrane protein